MDTKFSFMRLIVFLFLVFLGMNSTIYSQEEVNQFDLDGNRHGVWKKYYDEESKQLRYEGAFLHGKEIGDFKFYCEDCGTTAIMVKSFNENNDFANVKYFSKKGKLISEGKMKGKIRVGEWIYYHKGTNIIMTKENYNNGILDGKKVTFYKTKIVAEEINYNNGIKEGPNFYYSPTGKFLKKLFYVNDELHGKGIYYDAKGDVVLEGNYKKGKKHGVWKTYKDGKFVKEEKFPKEYRD